jgi:hypothetical protein
MDKMQISTEPLPGTGSRSGATISMFKPLSSLTAKMLIPAPAASIDPSIIYACPHKGVRDASPETESIVLLAG